MVNGLSLENGRSLQLLACLPQQENQDTGLHRYTRQVAALLQGNLHWQSAEGSACQKSSSNGRNGYDLLFLNEAGWLSLAQPPEQPSVLLVREPRWPLRRLLLLIRGEATDHATIEWGVHLTLLTQAALTLLVVMPPVLPEGEQSIAYALKANTIPGCHIRAALHRLAANQVNGVLKVSHCLPEQQVQREVSAAQYDLIILGSEPRSRLFYWRLDSLIKPMLHWTPQSVLISGSRNLFEERFVYKEEQTAWQ